MEKAQKKQKIINKAKQISEIEVKLEEKLRKLEASNEKRDVLEKELITSRSELATIRRTLELERQKRKDLETHALGLIREAKCKWENAEKEKVVQLNKHIDAQTARITELYTSNNDMSSHLKRTECKLQMANAELDKLRVHQTQYKESLAKTSELKKQNVQNVEIELKKLVVYHRMQLADFRSKFDVETAKNTDLETRLRNEQDSNHCRESKLNVALELAQNELKDCQEQLRTIQATLPARDAEIEALRKQLQDRTNQIDDLKVSEKMFTTMNEQLEKMNLENEQLKQQLQVTKSDLNETMINLEQSEALALNLEQEVQDKAALQKKLKDSLEKEEEQMRKVGNLEELLKRLEHSVTKLEAENASLRRSDTIERSTICAVTTEVVNTKIVHQPEEMEKLQQQLQALREDIAAERQALKQSQLTLWKKEKELSDANLDKRIATREAKKSEERIKKLQEEKQNLQEKLTKNAKEEEENSKKLLTELEIAKSSLNDITREASTNKMQADSVQRALTQANRQIEELQSSSALLRRELDAVRKQMQLNQDRIDNLNSENERLTQATCKHNKKNATLEYDVMQLEQQCMSLKIHSDFLKDTCTTLEEQLMDYERLMTDHKTRENTLIQDKMKLQKDLEAAEIKVREVRIAQNEERWLRQMVERNVEQLKSKTSDIESERNSLITQIDQYKELVQELNIKVEKLTAECNEMECDLSKIRHPFEDSKAESRIVNEKAIKCLTAFHELREATYELMYL